MNLQYPKIMGRAWYGRWNGRLIKKLPLLLSLVFGYLLFCFVILETIVFPAFHHDVTGTTGTPAGAFAPLAVTYVSTAESGRIDIYLALFLLTLAGFAFMGGLHLLLQEPATAPKSLLPPSRTKEAVMEGRDSVRHDPAGHAPLSASQTKGPGPAFPIGTGLASGLLHNLRNDLTPMIVDVESLLSRLPVAQLEEAARLCQEAAPRERASMGKQDVVRFIQLSLNMIRKNEQEVQNRLLSLVDQMERFEKRLNDQYQLMTGQGAVEWVEMAALAAEAMDLLPSGLRDSIVLDLTGMEPGMQAQVGRGALLEVLVNLLTNAAESIIRAGRSPAPVRVYGTTQTGPRGNLIHLVVQDEGAGIPVKSLSTLFQPGITAKRKPASGMGLCWCLDIMNSLHGRIWAESDGPGLGAKLHLLFPSRPNQDNTRVPEKREELHSGLYLGE